MTFYIFRHGPIIIYTRLPAGESTIWSACSPRTVSAWLAFLMPFLPFGYGYRSSSPRAHCTPNKSVPTLCYTHNHGPIYTGHACRHILSAVPWISEDRLFTNAIIMIINYIMYWLPVSWYQSAFLASPVLHCKNGDNFFNRLAEHKLRHNHNWAQASVVLATNSKHLFTTSFLQPLPYLVTP